jgi:hypothetical protein
MREDKEPNLAEPARLEALSDGAFANNHHPPGH